MERYRIRRVALILIFLIVPIVPAAAESDFILSQDQPPLSSPYEIANLTFAGESCNLAAGSPDGTEIALLCKEWKQPCNCTSTWMGCAKEDAQLYLMKNDGSDKHQISDLTVFGVPLWNPQGNAIAIKGLQSAGSSGGHSSNKGIWIIEIDKSTEYLLINDSNAWGAAWSPDGRFLAYTIYNAENITVNIIAADNSSSRQLYSLPHLGGYDILSGSAPYRKAGLEDTIRWSDDGKSLSFISGESWTLESGQLLIVKVDIDGSVISRTPMSTNSSYRISEFAWHQSSERFAFISNFSYQPFKNQLRIVDPADGTEVALSDGYYSSLQWSAAANGFIFTDHGDIWRVGKDGNGRTPLTMNGSVRFITLLPGSEKIIYSESLNITNCEPRLGYFGIGWPQREMIWQNWTTASRIGVLDLDTPVRSSTSSPGFDILAVILAIGTTILFVRKRR